MASEKPRPSTNKASLATARFIPPFLVLIVVYCSYVVVGPLSLDYLINNHERPPRVAVGLAITIAWFVLLIPVIATWIRLLLVVFGEPGYTPRGLVPQDSCDVPVDFWERDVFVCDPKGLPIYCRHCENWKPDRTHHNQDSGRCTLKMDHFCPWVGGVVGERAQKFFIQFLTYALILCTFLMTVMAIFVHETKSQVHWMVALGISAFFVLFTLGMVMNTLHMIFRNVTTIENINTGAQTMLLAVLLPPELQPHLQHSVSMPEMAKVSMGGSLPGRLGGKHSQEPLTSDLDDPSHARYFSNMNLTRPLRRPSRSQHWRGTVTYPLYLPTDRPPLPAPTPRTFAILETWPGMNPWDLGSPWRNFKAVMGTHAHDWILPFKHSPCCDHSSCVSWYPLGPQFEAFLDEVGLVNPPRPPSRRERVAGLLPSDAPPAQIPSQKRRQRRLPEGWQNGERPDGWISEKQARRHRHYERGRHRRDEMRQVTW